MTKEIKNKALKKAVDVKGSQALLAEAIGCHQSTISRALRGTRLLPVEFVLSLEAETGVPRHQVRPDIYPKE